MASSAYRAGLLLVVFGGFLATNSAGVAASLAVWTMFLGLVLGLLGVLQSGLGGADSRAERERRPGE